MNKVLAFFKQSVSAANVIAISKYA